MNEHVTRFSDASTFDEICINCGATDARGSNLLNEPCPKSVEFGGKTLKQYYDELKSVIKGDPLCQNKIKNDC